MGRNQKTHRRHGLGEIVDKQRLLANRSVNVCPLVQVTDTYRRLANDFDRLLAANCRHRKVAGFIHCTFECIGGQRSIGPPLRHAKCKDGGHQNITRLAHAGCKFGIGIKCHLCIGNDLAKLFGDGTLARLRDRRVGQHILHLADKYKAWIGLRFKEKSSVGYRFGLGGRQLVNQLCMHVARPGPAPYVRNALVINRDDGDALGRLA